MSTPTQVRRPWRATARTVFAGIVAFAALLPFIVEASGLEPEVYPWLGGILAVAAAVTRIMALPQVEAFLTRFVPWLAADPAGGTRPIEGFDRAGRPLDADGDGRFDSLDRGAIDVGTAVLVGILVLLVLIALGVFR